MTEHLSNGQFASKEVAEPTTKEVTKSGTRFKPGHPKYGGRKKGTPNKVSRPVKEFLSELCDDPDVQLAVKGRVLKGDAIAFFRALEHVVGKPTETTDINLNGTLHVYKWGGE